jgi:hypothetical protein
MNILDIKKESTKTVKIKGLDFSIKAVLPKERMEIAVKKAYLLGGVALESISFQDAIFAEKLATIDACTVEFPENTDWSKALDIPDSGIIESLFEEIKNLTEALDGKLKKNKTFEGSAKE